MELAKSQRNLIKRKLARKEVKNRPQIKLVTRALTTAIHKTVSQEPHRRMAKRQPAVLRAAVTGPEVVAAVILGKAVDLKTPTMRLAKSRIRIKKGIPARSPKNNRPRL